MISHETATYLKWAQHVLKHGFADTEPALDAQYISGSGLNAEALADLAEYDRKWVVVERHDVSEALTICSDYQYGVQAEKWYQRLNSAVVVGEPSKPEPPPFWYDSEGDYWTRGRFPGT
jgi:hypothetical protein